MRTGLGIGIAVGAAALSFGAGYVVGTVPVIQRLGEATKMRDNFRAVSQVALSAERSPTTDRAVVDLVLELNASEKGRNR